MSPRTRSALAAVLVVGLAAAAIAVIGPAGGTGTGTAAAAGRAPRFTASSTTGRFEPGPSTIRPHEGVAELLARLERSDVLTFVVTRPDGTLVGVVRREDITREAQLDPD